MQIGQVIYQGKTEKGKDILIRYPQKDDLQALINYINTLSKEQTFIRFQGEQVTLEEETKYLDELMKKLIKSEAIQLLVFHNDQLIGISGINMMDKTEKHIGVFGISIAKDYRDEGIGKTLMQLVLDEAQRNLPNLKIATLGLFAINTVAYELYKKFGFKEYGKIPKGLIHKGEYIDHIYMYKEIQ